MEESRKELHGVDVGSLPVRRGNHGSLSQADGIQVTLSNVRHLNFVGNSGMQFTLNNGRVVELSSNSFWEVVDCIKVGQRGVRQLDPSGDTSPFVLHDKEPSAAPTRSLQKGIVSIGGLILDPITLRCMWNGELVKLTAGEFALVMALAKRPGDVKSRGQLIDEVFGHNYAGFDRSIDSCIKRIRRKFRVVDPSFAQIEAVYGAGYRYYEGDRNLALLEAKRSLSTSRS